MKKIAPLFNPSSIRGNDISVIRGAPTLPQLSRHYWVKCLILWLNKRRGLVSLFPYSISIMRCSPFFSKARRWPLDLCRNPFLSAWERTGLVASNPLWTQMAFSSATKSPKAGFFCGNKVFLPAWDTKAIIWPWLWSLKLICDFHDFLPLSTQTWAALNRSVLW